MRRIVYLTLIAVGLVYSCGTKNRHETIGGGYGIGGVIDSNRVGEWKFFFENDGLEAEGSFEDDLEEGKWMFYHVNGRLKQESYWHKGCLDGAYQTFYRNGSKQVIGEFTENKRSGLWTYFSQD